MSVSFHSEHRFVMLQVAVKDLTLLSPVAGAFWTPQRPPAYNAELPA